MAQWYPDLISHVFAVCTPYFKIHDQYVSTEMLVKNGVPQFGYQLQFGSPDHQVENVVTDETRMRKTLKGFYGGRASSGRPFMLPEKGIDLESVQNDDFTMTPLFDDEVYSPRLTQDSRLK